jgi:hypothetical protein
MNLKLLKVLILVSLTSAINSQFKLLVLGDSGQFEEFLEYAGAKAVEKDSSLYSVKTNSEGEPVCIKNDGTKPLNISFDEFIYNGAWIDGNEKFDQTQVMEAIYERLIATIV